MPAKHSRIDESRHFSYSLMACIVAANRSTNGVYLSVSTVVCVHYLSPTSPTPLHSDKPHRPSESSVFSTKSERSGTARSQHSDTAFRCHRMSDSEAMMPTDQSSFAFYPQAPSSLTGKVCTRFLSSVALWSFLSNTLYNNLRAVVVLGLGTDGRGDGSVGCVSIS
jgi:hypothetical protein